MESIFVLGGGLSFEFFQEFGVGFAIVGDDAAVAVGSAGLAHVTAMQYQPVMRFRQQLGRYVPA